MAKMISSIYSRNDASMRELYQKDTQPKTSRAGIRLFWNITSRRYELAIPYDRRFAAKQAGFHWDSIAKCWFTDNHRKAVRLIKFADDSTKKQLLYFFA